MQELLIGDPAPAIRLAEFVKGAPLPNLELGKVYVLEFWATWCGPCQANVPHLSDLQDKYPQATFIGVAAMEPDTEVVRTFVEEMGDQIRYRIAIEELLAGRSGREGGSMTKHWLEASYQRGIPAAFIVNPAGLIAWIGHPIDLDEPLTAIINGSWDLDGKAQSYRQMLTVNHVRQKFHLQQEIKKARVADKDANIAAVIDTAIAADPILEKEFGAQKLDALMKDPGSKSSALDYAAYLIEGLCHEDAQALLLLSVVLFKPDGAPLQGDGLVPDADFARLAVQAMNRIETLLRQDPSAAPMIPHVRMQYEEHFARALVASGRAGEALEHAEHAYRCSKEAGVSGDVLAKIEILKTRCQGSQSFGTMTNPAFD
ncbi:MAG: TlpA family protein disulfide reductase [Methylocella sp.]